MKRFSIFVLILGVSLPLVAGASIASPNGNFKFKQNINQPPSLKEFQKTPKSLAGGLEQHIKMIQFKLDHLADSQVPEDKRAIVQADLEAELAWAQAMLVKVAEATTPEAEGELREEIKAHLIEVQQQRQEKLSQQIKLPSTSPFDKAEEIGEHFSTILQNLRTNGIETDELEQAVVEYNRLVEEGQVGFSQVNADQSFDHVTDFRDQLQAVRAQGQLVRNLIQSILTSNSVN